jgi:hypothetical protein
MLLRTAFDFVYYEAFIVYTHIMSGVYTNLLEGSLAGQDHIVTSIIEERLEKKRGTRSRQKRSATVDYSVVF